MDNMNVDEAVITIKAHKGKDTDKDMDMAVGTIVTGIQEDTVTVKEKRSFELEL